MEIFDQQNDKSYYGEYFYLAFLGDLDTFSFVFEKKYLIWLLH